MKQEQFIAAHEAEWQRLEGWLEKKSRNKTAQRDKASPAEFAAL